jgi:hypothetical protein
MHDKYYFVQLAKDFKAKSKIMSRASYYVFKAEITALCLFNDKGAVIAPVTEIGVNTQWDGFLGPVKKHFSGFGSAFHNLASFFFWKIFYCLGLCSSL